jgi:tRNA modification GTPase
VYASTEDTIVAVSSAAGHAARGIIRLSGPAAIEIAARMFRSLDGTPLRDLPGFTNRSGQVVFDDDYQAPAVVYLFRAPSSYTRQDVVELHTVGSPPLLDMVMERCLSSGARLAQPGEFTARAFLFGAMSLTEAESVAATIRARSDQQLRAARRLAEGDLARTIHAWQQELAELLALVVADIDFAEEPIDFISPDQLVDRLERLAARLETISQAAQAGRRFDALPHVLLTGPPNSGKSTLLNVLSGMDRAIASAVSGTTRDILSEPIRLPGCETIMLDSAGIDDSPDEVIAHGRQRALEAAASVELVCLVFDASAPIAPAQVRQLAALAAAPTLLIGTKIDRSDPASIQRRRDELQSAGVGPVCLVSAANGSGIDALREALAERLGSDPGNAEDVGISLSARQREALGDARTALGRCLASLAGTNDVLDAAELVALELREALDALGRISGTITTEDLLGRVFASFCIGK